VIAAVTAALAGRCGWSYFKGMDPPLSTQQDVVQDIVSVSPSSDGMRSAAVWGIAGLGVIALFGALALWFRYGTTVFFEMIASGISSCF
jgi:hypothetical protein